MLEMPIRRPNSACVSSSSVRSADMVRGSLISFTSDHPKFLSTRIFRIAADVFNPLFLYHYNMARKKLPADYVGPDWYLIEWMRYYGKSQSFMAKAIGVSESTMSDICNGRTSYYRALVNDLASALNVQPYELLMPPDKAHRFRGYDNAVLSVAAERHIEFGAFEAEDEEPARRRG